MELINNTTKTLKDDLSVEIKQGSKVSIAAACFSIYAFQELKEQLSQIEQLRFIFTSPTFVTEKAKKERREFYIPRMTRERSLYGTEFEIKLRNELTQKAIARECAEWIRQKVTFKSNISDKSIQGQIVVDGVGYLDTCATSLASFFLPQTLKCIHQFLLDRGLSADTAVIWAYQKVQHKILWDGVLLSRLESLQNPCADPPHDCRGRKACNLLNILYGKQV